MRRLILVGIVMLAIGIVTAFLVAKADAQEPKDLTPRLMHGPLIGVTTVRTGVDGRMHTAMFNGAGYQVGVSLVDAASFSWLSIGMPHIMTAESSTDTFAYSTGLNVTFLGNFGFGAVLDLVRTGGEKDSGLFTGYSDKQNLTYLFTVTFPLGGGGSANLYR